tara:strand:+ start:3834 stop:4802 length:969 start_codon:yes stop_codon:yes gene_type:complete
LNLRDQIVACAKRTIDIEQDALAHLQSLIDDGFVHAVETVFNSTGRVILTGVGKSAIIAQKIVATLNSTGTPAIYMHAADAIHGDLGTILKDDVVICLSKSGNTPEIEVLVPYIKSRKNKIIAITSNKDSFLAKQADHIIYAYAEKEACPHDLAPTTSTTVQMVMGDALAIALLELRGFTSQDFARYHPGGALGKKLYMRVSDLTAQNEKPQVSTNTPIKDVIIEISAKMLGVVAVLEDKKIVGIITDGDIRRMLQHNEVLTGLTALDIMSKDPKTVANSAMAAYALEIMENHNISQLLATDENGCYTGVVHIHDLIKEGIL